MISRSKCLIQTVPVGRSQPPEALNPSFCSVSGTENQRRFLASSDQNGWLTS